MKSIEEKKSAFAEMVETIATLRQRCPWDKKQTMESLKNLTVEEVYELGEAIIDSDMDEVKKELGDLIMHIVFYAHIGEEQGDFDIADVLSTECEKLRYRHPHIYGEVKAEDAEEVLKNWEALKLQEKGRKHRVLEGVPKSLPAMVKAYRIQDKAKGAGFDWSHREEVWEKVKEEVAEVADEMTAVAQAEHGQVTTTEGTNANRERTLAAERLEMEFGDLLFAVVNACRLYGINPENALEKTNRKFISRFTKMEDDALESGRHISELSLEEQENLWKKAKQSE